MILSSNGSIGSSSTGSSRFNYIIVGDEVLFKTFDKVNPTETEVSELYVECGLAEWNISKTKQRFYHVANFPARKALLVDFCQIAPKELSGYLLDALSKIAERTKSEFIYVAISSKSSSVSSFVRCLGIYGFEGPEIESWTSDKNVIIMKMEVNQEDDYVEL